TNQATTNQATTNTTQSAPKAQAPKPVAVAAMVSDSPEVQYTPKRVASPSITPVISISRIGANKHTEQAPSEEKADRAMNHRNIFSDEQLIQAWNSYITDHPREVVLINAMRSNLPTRVDENFTYSVVVDNNAQQEAINNHLAGLLDYLRQRVDNDFFTLRTSINENVAKVAILSPQDIVVEMMTKNDKVKTLIQTFQLGIA
ncbi:MAG: hypothetical protein PHR45_03770, partial [Muribaculaceae bacterium]|nr:hypothetical protein [Muribaculaceae bacterium]